MGSQGDEPLSLECVKRSDMYPKISPVCDDPAIQQIPFPLLCGENGLFLGRCADGVVTLTSFRLNICQRRSFLNIPLRLIESLESRDMFYLVIFCKDATTVRCKFSCNEGCQLWLKRLQECTGAPKDLTKIFAFPFFSHGSELEATQLTATASMSAYDQAAQLCVPLEDKYTYSFGKDLERMQFDTSKRKVWRILQLNEDYSLCRSYPRHHILPASLTDEQIKSVASFRSGSRFPSVVWRDQRNGAVIARCSQPELGWLGWRNTEDELYATAIPEACAQDTALSPQAPHKDSIDTEDSSEEGQSGSTVKVLTAKKMLVMDCRSYSAAIANRAKGGGCESPDYYTNCEIKFMNMANIHSIRKSYQALRLLCSNFPDQNYLSSLEATRWLQHVGAILYSTQVVVSAVEDARPVLIHCSDGWDRTAQISSLAQLALDPYYRTIKGFQWLVEREWLQFGHKFADRCGHAVGSGDVNEQSPVFVQWLDCVYQATRQFPCHFQFNEAFLIKLVQHTFSCLFGNFLFNTCREREHEAKTNPTSSVWTLLHPDNTKFHNPLYNQSAKEVLTLDWSLHRLTLWNSVYLSNNSLKTSSADEFAASVEQADQVLTPDEEHGTLTKTRSCENLTTVTAGPPEGGGSNPARRSSDPSIGCGGDTTMALLSKEVDSSQPRPPLDLDNNNADSLPDAASDPVAGAGSQPVVFVHGADTPPCDGADTSPCNGVDYTPPSAVHGVDTPPCAVNGEDTSRCDVNGVDTPPCDVNGVDAPPCTIDGADTPLCTTNGADTPSCDVNGKDASPCAVNGTTEEEIRGAASCCGVQEQESECEGMDSSVHVCDDDDASAVVVVDEGEACPASHQPQQQHTVAVNGLLSKTRRFFGGDNVAGAMSYSEALGVNGGGGSVLNGLAGGDGEEEEEREKECDVVRVNGHRHSVAAEVHREETVSCVEADTQTSEFSLRMNGHHHHHASPGQGQGCEESSSAETFHSSTDVLTTKPFGGSTDTLTKACESSTDTLTGCEDIVDPALFLKSRRRYYSDQAASPSSVMLQRNGNGNGVQNGNGHCYYPHGEDEDEAGEMIVKRNGRRDLDAASVESLKLMIAKNCSISTSTTDISDSHVSVLPATRGGGNGVAAEVFSRAAGLGLYIRCNNGMCGAGGAGAGGVVGRRTPTSSEASPSVCSLVATPINSQTPPSTCSPTPGSEGKSSESPLVRQLNSVARHLDCDGLTTFVDPALERVQTMMTEYQRRINHLEQRLETATNHLNSIMPPYHGAGRAVESSEYMNFQSELSDGGELSSLGTESNPASDVSWEQVDERDSRITLWVPDHVVTHCAACGGNFWIGRRKHHCRNCGKVYCYTCSNFFAPVPTQYLAEPVRLCGSCYNQLHLSGHGAASDDSRITVGAE